jgi:hypothetical protein
LNKLSSVFLLFSSLLSLLRPPNGSGRFLLQEAEPNKLVLHLLEFIECMRVELPLVILLPVIHDFWAEGSLLLIIVVKFS